jgi:putative FmdB family regulatory protein
MPTYDYVCQSCEHAFEHFQSMTSDLLKDCPKCAKPSLKRLIGAGGALIFKGTGFYCTDYKKPSSPDKKVDRAKEASKQIKESAAPASSGGGESTSSTSAPSVGPVA